MSRVALVTGGAGGIGAATARRLSTMGFRVVLTYHTRQEQAMAVADEIGGRALPLNLREARSLTALLAELASEPPVQVLVHNAGLIRDSLLPFLSEEDWDAVYQVNLKGPFLLTKALIRGMLRERWGRVVAVSSLSGVAGQPGQTHYSAAKAGLIAFVKTLAVEVASYGVTANAVAPGFVDTAMLAHLPEKKREELRAAVPLKRFADPAEIAELIAYLASDASAYVTGQTFRIDGGMMRC